MEINAKYNSFTPIFTINAVSEDKIVKLISNHNCSDAIYEIRVDSFLDKKISLDNIIYILNNVISIFSEHKFLITMRTKEEAGLVDIGYKEYFDIWWEIFNKTTPQFMDIKYEIYKKDVRALEYLRKLTDYNNTKVISSYHSIKKHFDINESSALILDMIENFGDIVKYAVNIDNKHDLFMFMNFTHLLNDKLVNKNKEAIFIVMGDMGKISRVWPEYTNSKYMFYSLDENNKIKNTTGQITIDELKILRKKIGLKD